jgi:hypothetical protein
MRGVSFSASNERKLSGGHGERASLEAKTF